MNDKEKLKIESLLDENKIMKKELEHVAFCLGVHVATNRKVPLVLLPPVSLEEYESLVENLNIYLMGHQKVDDNGDLYEEIV